MRRNGSTTKPSETESGEPGLECVDGALHWARRQLWPSRTAALDAQVLLAHVAGASRVWVLAHPEARLSEEQVAHYRELIERRATGVPVAYVRGWIEWHGRRFEVTEDVLVPRPETELLLERAVELSRLYRWQAIADIGTGSGVLAVEMAVLLPDATVQATDVSGGALEVARRNAARHGVSDRVRFLVGDLAEPLMDEPDLIVANLPYLSDEMMREIGPDVRHEPPSALHGGPTGLELIERLLQGLRVRGWSVPLLLEIDPRQSHDIPRLFGADVYVEIFSDYAGHNRIVSAFPDGA